jgi:hypothetical protein
VVASDKAYLQEEIDSMEARSAQIISAIKHQLAALKLKGTVRKEEGAIAPEIFKYVPKQDGLLVVGSKSIDTLNRVMLGSVSTNLISYATCPVLVVRARRQQPIPFRGNLNLRPPVPRQLRRGRGDDVVPIFDRLAHAVTLSSSAACPYLSWALRFLPFRRDRVHFRFETEAWMKAHQSAGRDYHSCARAEVPSLASAYLEL